MLSGMSSTTGKSTAELLTAYAVGRRDFSGWSISGGVLLRERFEGCTFERAQFRECAGAFSTFDNCSLAGAEFTHCLFNGVDFTSSSLEGCSFNTCVLDRGDYFMSALRGSRFVSSSMRKSCFLRANLSDCYLQSTDLSGSVFGRTTLSASTLLGPDFEDTVVALPHVISRAEFKQLYGMAYAASLFSDAPSVPGDPSPTPDTPHLDSNNARAICALIPGIVEFLERGGVPSDQLVPLRNVIDLNLQRAPASVFLSYATEDEPFAQELAKVLARSGLEIWFAPRSMRGGQKLYDQLMREVDGRDRFVLVVSRAAMTSSWVDTELRRAVKSANRSSHRRVIPVLLVEEEEWRSWTIVDPDSGRDLALELRAGPAYSFTGPALELETDSTTVRALVRELVEPASMIRDGEGGPS
jgi:uncharacterized protein YjbI with pentapeptide repeats